MIIVIITTKPSDGVPELHQSDRQDREIPDADLWHSCLQAQMQALQIQGDDDNDDDDRNVENEKSKSGKENYWKVQRQHFGERGEIKSGRHQQPTDNSDNNQLIKDWRDQTFC